MLSVIRWQPSEVSRFLFHLESLMADPLVLFKFLIQIQTETSVLVCTAICFKRSYSTAVMSNMMWSKLFRFSYIALFPDTGVFVLKSWSTTWKLRGNYFIAGFSIINKKWKNPACKVQGELCLKGWNVIGHEFDTPHTHRAMWALGYDLSAAAGFTKIASL